MNYFLASLALLAILCHNSVVAEGGSSDKYQYEIKSIQVPLDHFNKGLNTSFALRYLYNNTYVSNNVTGPIFFYTGNEGDIEVFAKNTGFLWESASIYRALVVFCEHRYYGKSMPFGDSTFNNTDHLGYLSVEQALEDFVQLIDQLNPDQERPVIAFGGSYGGMLAAWLRVKYPHVVTGAIAASAPVWQFNGITPCDIFSKVTTSIFENSYSANCSANIKKSWDHFKKLAGTDDGRKQLNNAFQFCKPMTQEKDIDKFLDFLEDVYGNLAMANYPYENDFLAELPAYPVRQFCLYLKDLQPEATLLEAMRSAISVYTNYSTHVHCLELTDDASDLGGTAWDVQTCGQMVMPMCSSASETMFREKKWDFASYSNKCVEKYKIHPDMDDIIKRYGGRNMLQYSSNIVFSNGLLDPWSGGGVLSSFNDAITVILIPEGAHHLDLRGYNTKDPVSVLTARDVESKKIEQWIGQFQQLKKYFH